MNVISIALCLLLAAMAVSATGSNPADQNPDECVCVSANFGCEAIKNRIKMVQMGWCNKRCCSYASDEGKRECKCTYGASCPEHLPEENGNCSHLVYCCPEKVKRKQEL